MQMGFFDLLLALAIVFGPLLIAGMTLSDDPEDR
jgi:hypothetical protein